MKSERSIGKDHLETDSFRGNLGVEIEKNQTDEDG